MFGSRKPYEYTSEAVKIMQQAIEKFGKNSLAKQELLLGFNNNEPVLIMADSLIRYALSIKKMFGKDYMANQNVANLALCIKDLLNHNGAVSMERGLTTDSKEDSIIEAMLVEACRILNINYHELHIFEQFKE